MTRIRLSTGKGDVTLDTEMTDGLLKAIHQMQTYLNDYRDEYRNYRTISTGHPMHMPEGSDGHEGWMTPVDAECQIALWAGVEEFAN